MDDIDKFDAALERLEAERERRLAETVEAGEIVSVALSVVVGTASQLPLRSRQAKTDKLAELRAAGDKPRNCVRRDNGRHRRVPARRECRGPGVEARVAAIPAEVQLPAPARKKRFEKNHSPRSSRPMCRFKSANARTMTILARSRRAGSVSMAGS